jgi:hypothetical protein
MDVHPDYLNATTLGNPRITKVRAVLVIWRISPRRSFITAQPHKRPRHGSARDKDDTGLHNSVVKAQMKRMDPSFSDFLPHAATMSTA